MWKSIVSVACILALCACREPLPPQPSEVSTAPAAIERVPLPDADRDGVADVLDRCADTLAGVVVDGDGCEPDGDGDGVPDRTDRCADSPPGEAVDASGCRPRLTAARTFMLAVDFASGSAVVVGDARAALAPVVQLLEQYPEASVTVEGHTDDRGSARRNREVSAARAQAVATELGRLGISAARVTAIGHGPSKPIASNATPEGRAVNRRVVAIVMPAG